jgi:hypothetical protein
MMYDVYLIIENICTFLSPFTCMYTGAVIFVKYPTHHTSKSASGKKTKVVIVMWRLLYIGVS